jgi:predicted nucleotidyltransferase
MTSPPKSRDPLLRRVGEPLGASVIDPSALASQLREAMEREPRVLLVYVFGSQARGDTGPGSDLDVGVLVTRDASIASLRMELTHILSKFSGEIPLDVIILNQAPLELAYSVISGGHLVYERSTAERVEYEANVMSRYGDYLPYLRMQRDDIVEGVGNDRRVQRYREALGRTQRALGALGTPEATAPC